MTLSHSPRNRKRPTGFYAAAHAPKPAADLRIFHKAGYVVKIHVKGESDYRWPSAAMPLDHPAIANLTTGYTLDEEYASETTGLIVRRYFVSELVSELETASVESVSETETEPLRPPTPAAEEAAGLVSEYPHLAKRIGLALELIETGQLAGQMQKYGTEWQNLTRAGNWICDCPDSLHRQPVAAFGRACKHCLAGEILARVKRTARRIQMQKLESKNARRSEESARRYALALSPGGGSPLNTPRYQFGRGR